MKIDKIDKLEDSLIDHSDNKLNEALIDID